VYYHFLCNVTLAKYTVDHADMVTPKLRYKIHMNTTCKETCRHHRAIRPMEWRWSMFP